MNYFRTLASEKAKRYLYYEMIDASQPFRPILGVVALVAFTAFVAYPVLGFALEVVVFLLLLYGAFLIARKEWRKSEYRKDIKESNREVQISDTRVSDPPQIRR